MKTVIYLALIGSLIVGGYWFSMTPGDPIKSECLNDKAKKDIEDFVSNIKEITELARVSDALYGELPNKISLDSGLDYVENYNDEERSILIVFSGTEPNSINDWENNVKQYFNQAANQYRDADELVRDAIEKYPRYKIRLVGHSLGGSLATYASLIHGTEAITYAPTRLSALSLRNAIERNPNLEETPVDNVEHITHIRVNGDVFTGNRANPVSVLPGKQFIMETGEKIPTTAHAIKHIIEFLEHNGSSLSFKKVCQFYYGYNPHN